ncbi:MAG: ABC transporter substrate-binding protein [Firmicutes bacterium]|nr:ABC transporter substrate-binding protein [Bacillota bacterium]
MKKAKLLLAVLLVFVMVFSMAACGGNGGNEGGGSEGGETTEETPMVVGYSHFSSKFSPFFAETAYDQDVASMTQISLITTDRLGNVIMKGIEGEKAEYNGTEYTYYGPADLEMTENPDGTVFYDFTLRDDLTFSDGEPVTIDDVIFTMYVLCDPTYDGSSTLFAVPIEGMDAYRSGMDTLGNLIVAAGPDNTNFDFWTEDQQKTYWDNANAAAVAIAQEICDYCVAAGYNDEGDVAGCAGNWGFSVPEGGTVEDFAAVMMEAYGGNIANLVGTENAGSSIDDVFPGYEEYTVGVETGESAANISGIQKTGDYSMRIVATKVDAPAIYNLGVNITPLHYYGDPSKYDYDNNMFGFDKGDLSSVRAKTTEPMGAGVYKFVSYENGVVNFEANENYFKGAPKTKYVQFREMTDADKLNGLITGTVDVTDPSFSKDTAKAVSDANSNKELTGDVITTSLVDNLGYGYIGINSVNVSVGGQPDSDASKNLRKAFATIFSVHRDVAIDSYYADAAEVINYPISNTSWAAPPPTDSDYRLAFSVDVDGNDIYTSDMSADDKTAAAKAAALGFLEAAGYTVADGKVTAAPEGAKLEYEAMIPADGSGDHPAFMILTLAKEDLAELGINLIINDLSNSSDLWTALEAGDGEIWCAAWGATIDPDMYQIYYADVANGGAQAGGSNYMYKIADPALDEMILDARTSTDQAYRKAMYKACLDTIIDWACEVPTYQRQNCIIFSTERVNIDTVTPDITTFYGWMAEIENTEMN